MNTLQHQIDDMSEVLQPALAAIALLALGYLQQAVSTVHKHSARLLGAHGPEPDSATVDGSYKGSPLDKGLPCERVEWGVEGTTLLISASREHIAAKTPLVLIVELTYTTDESGVWVA